jgi:hypothetical protein
MPCPSCGEPASGRFCSSCGTALAGATCATCSAALTPGARFCHRCGTPAGATSTVSRGLAGVLPWAVAAIALMALIALVVGQRFGARGPAVTEVAADSLAPADAAASGPVGVMPRAPDISQLSPEERAQRLYDRIMKEAEAGHAEVVGTFMPMAVAAYQMISPLNADQRYDLGRLGEVGGDSALARAEADTILKSKPTHLLGLILRGRAARMEHNESRARDSDLKLLAAAPKERASGLKEYEQHKNDIDAAIAAAQSASK